MPRLAAPLCALDGYCYLFLKGWAQAELATDMCLLGTATEFVVRNYWHNPLTWMQAQRDQAAHYPNRTNIDDWAQRILRDYRAQHDNLAIWMAMQGLPDRPW
ncbi:hypothetical protein GCM10022408_37950 [Hymenobacter fastidiosus]|uniref:Uncharacterized protein n=1 Tax=Hymenobacter fastidiosus TaxID=486264 RepID=A0ABP7T329_9BACT